MYQSTKCEGGSVRFWLTAMMLVSCVWIISSCGESVDNQARKESAKTVGEAKRLVADSHRCVFMTEDEIDQAAEFGEFGQEQYQRLAQQIVERREKQVQLAEFEQSMTEIGQLQQKLQPGDIKGLEVISHRLTQASQQLLGRYRKIDGLALAENQQRLKTAKEILRDARDLAQRSGVRQTQVGPELMLGTLHLMLARDYRDQLHQQDGQIHNKQLAIGYLTIPITTEQIIVFEMKSYQAKDAAEEVQARLNGTVEETDALPTMVQELAQVEQRVEKLKAAQHKMQEKINFNMDKARELHEQYLSLLDEAEKTRGHGRYELQERAYDLRGGSGEGADRVEGGIYYEAQAELAQNRLAVINSQLDYEQLRRRQLTATIAQTQDTIERLRNPANADAVQDSLKQSRQHREQLISLLQVPYLEDLKAAETRYSEIRLDAATAFDEAFKAYARAAGAAGRLRKLRDYADQMSRIAKQELANLWLADAHHYQASAASIRLTEDIKEIRNVIRGMRENYEKQAEQADASATKLQQELQQEEPS